VLWDKAGEQLAAPPRFALVGELGEHLLDRHALLLNLERLLRLPTGSIEDDRDRHQADCLTFAGPHDLDGALDRLDRVAPRKGLHLALGLGHAAGIAGVSRQVMAAFVALRRQDFTVRDTGCM
jgi:hypothetical protein